jgi:radical SAM-linked protein
VRVTFSKGGPLKYTSHLDLARAWERSLRRAGVPLAYSRGFSPRPKLQLAAALPLGHSAEAEMVDVWLEQRMGLEALARALPPALPAGLVVRQVQEVGLRDPALQTQVVASEYRVTVEWDDAAEELEERLGELLSAAELPDVRRGKSYDLRPLIERLWLADERSDARGEAVLGMVLAARQGATARPEAVVEALGLQDRFPRYCRLGLVTGD